MRITAEAVRRFGEELLELPRDEWPERIAQQAGLWSCHTSTVRRRLQSDARIQLGEERGEHTSYIPDEDVKTVAMTIARTIRKGRAGLTTEQAIVVCERDGRLKAVRTPAVSTMRRRMRELGINVDQLTAPTPHTRLRSLHGNHVHQLDASLCIQWSFGKKGFNYRFVDLHKIDQTKKIKQAIHRWLIVDHLSGAYLTWYVDVSGERVEDVLRFLHWAWLPKEDPRVPMAGCPDILYLDRGPAFLSHPIKNLTKELGIKLIHHEAGRARATGSAEVSHWHHERQFEAKLRLQRINSVEELVEKARLEDIYANACRTHSRHGRTRFDAWTQSVKRPLRVPTSDFQAWCWLAHRLEETRQVGGDYTISYAQKGVKSQYRLVDAQVGETVTVRPHPFEAGNIRVFNADGSEIRVTRSVVDEWGIPVDAPVIGEEYAKIPDTPAQRIVKEAASQEPFKHAFLTDEDLPRDVFGWETLPTTPAGRADISSSVLQPERLSRIEAKEIVVAQLGRLSREESVWWNTRIGDGIDRAALEALLQEDRSDRKAAVA